MSGIDPRLSFLKPAKGVSQPAGADTPGEPISPPPPLREDVDPKLDLGAEPRRRQRPSWLPTVPPGALFRGALFALALGAGAAQVAVSAANAPPPVLGGPAPADNRSAAGQVIRVSAEARREISSEPMTWRAFFDHYDLPDAAREASMRQTLGPLSPADLDAAADAPIPQDRDIEIVLH